MQVFAKCKVYISAIQLFYIQDCPSFFQYQNRLYIFIIEGSQLAFYIILQRADIAPSATLIYFCRMLTKRKSKQTGTENTHATNQTKAKQSAPSSPKVKGDHYARQGPRITRIRQQQDKARKTSPSRKHAYISLTPLNPTFI